MHPAEPAGCAWIGYPVGVWPWLAAGALVAGSGAVPFEASLPRAIGDVSRWEVVTGEFETTAMRGEYAFYVNPARGALYQLMRYRVELIGAGNAEERARGSDERVAYVAHPGVREAMLCWQRQPGAEPFWREVPAGTPAYSLEMRVLMHVLAAHRAARLAPATPKPAPTPPR